jgi:hypothetical protein
MKIRGTVLAFLIGVTALAQPQRMTPQERTDQLAKQLALTAEQKVKVLDLFSKQDEARQKAFADNQGDREAMRATMQKMRDESTKKLKAILTEEQFATYEKLRSEMPPGRGGDTRPAQAQRMTSQERADQLAKQLALTAEQKAKVLDLFTKEDEARQKQSADNQGDREAMRATIQKMREESTRKLKAILTEEQFVKYEKLRSEMPPGGMGRRPD